MSNLFSRQPCRPWANGVRRSAAANATVERAGPNNVSCTSVVSESRKSWDAMQRNAIIGHTDAKCPFGWPRDGDGCDGWCSATATIYGLFPRLLALLATYSRRQTLVGVSDRAEAPTHGTAMAGARPGWLQLGGDSSGAAGPEPASAACGRLPCGATACSDMCWVRERAGSMVVHDTVQCDRAR